MRRAAKVDLTQNEIVKALRQIGASVQLLHTVGKGCPDAVVGYHGKNILLELKAGRGKLTSQESEWHSRWAGQVAVVSTPEEAQIAVIKAAGL